MLPCPKSIRDEAFSSVYSMDDFYFLMLDLRDSYLPTYPGSPTNHTQVHEYHHTLQTLLIYFPPHAWSSRFPAYLFFWEPESVLQGARPGRTNSQATGTLITSGEEQTFMSNSGVTIVHTPRSYMSRDIVRWQFKPLVNLGIFIFFLTHFT